MPTSNSFEHSERQLAIKLLFSAHDLKFIDESGSTNQLSVDSNEIVPKVNWHKRIVKWAKNYHLILYGGFLAFVRTHLFPILRQNQILN